ncbi:spindle and kinetochore-associated protein 2 isoform X3 [Carcharodon carcharias]|uniref:spindle and kinetochore-associated protein 2 isoform X3 n=1 Tax=Carcharodon carcharias TaxID=13397 RepID=UPI001B7DFE05|nr:spindle and kinetochore-associated protein 2 isoform X3 [Carcharodon carcharias]
MEAAVNKLEAMFQKAESDLDYIEHKLEFEIVKNLPQSTPTQENPVKLLEQLRVIKSHYHELSVEADQIASEQKEAVDFIRSHLATTLRLVQKLREQSDLKSCPLTENEQWAMQKVLKSEVLTEAGPSEEPCAKPPVPQQAEAEFEPITEKMFMSVPKSVRLTVKLADLNAFYQQLFDHFIRNKNSSALSVIQMNKLNMKATESKLKTLKALEILQLDKKGRVRLFMQCPKC